MASYGSRRPTQSGYFDKFVEERSIRMIVATPGGCVAAALLFGS
jgi:hypothetical protein